MRRTLALLLASLLAACGKTGTPLDNEPPTVRITGGPTDQSIDSYTARIQWRGWDDDGIVTHYEYATDPPPAFTLEEIGDPQAAGLRVRRIPGPRLWTDTLAVTKDVGGVTYRFDWVQTEEYARVFAFRTPDPDSAVEGGQILPDTSFSGTHTVFVRAQDDDAAYSAAEKLGYTARTVTPSSWITSPPIQVEIKNLGLTATVHWDGIDPDGTSADKKPAGFQFKLLYLDLESPKIPPVPPPDPGFLDRRGGAWTYRDADTTEATFHLAPGNYLFGVRAVDEAGGIEPFLEHGRNVFVFQALKGGGRPLLTLFEPSVGRFTFYGTQPCPGVEVATGAVLTFTWGADVSAYGGTVEGYSWGVDIDDAESEGIQNGWSAWGKDLVRADPLVFREPGPHTFYVRVKDISGTMTVGCLALEVIECRFEKEVLLVDDVLDGNYPTDAERDGFWNDRLQRYGEDAGWEAGAIDRIEPWGPEDRGSLDPAPPALSELGRYRLVIWDTHGGGLGGISALLKTATLSTNLRAYLAAGGKLWVNGRFTVRTMVPSPNGVYADPTYPKLLEPGGFAYDFMKLHTTKLDADEEARPQHTMVRAKPFPGQPEIYPFLEYDPLKLNPVLATDRGIASCEVVIDPIFAESEAGFRGDVDSLYVYGAAAELFGGTSVYGGRLCAVRWHDPDPGRRHGRTQWFGFPLYYFRDDQAGETFRKSVDWFREEGPPVH
jgi:hypothetical protein